MSEPPSGEDKAEDDVKCVRTREWLAKVALSSMPQVAFDSDGRCNYCKKILDKHDSESDAVPLPYGGSTGPIGYGPAGLSGPTGGYSAADVTHVPQTFPFTLTLLKRTYPTKEDTTKRFQSWLHSIGTTLISHGQKEVIRPAFEPSIVQVWDVGSPYYGVEITLTVVLNGMSVECSYELLHDDRGRRQDFVVGFSCEVVWSCPHHCHG